MKISVITVCRNAVDSISYAMDSVIRQRDADIEYIIVDGDSDDGTKDVVRAKAPSIEKNASFRFISEPDDGLYDAMNKGIRMATGDIIGIVNADDYLANETVLSEVASSFDEDVDCVCGDMCSVSRRGASVGRAWRANVFAPWMLRFGFNPAHPAIFIRRRCFLAWGFYTVDNRFRIGADYELLVRFFCKHHMSFRYIPAVTTIMVDGGVSTQKGWCSHLRCNIEIARAIRNNGYFTCLPMILFKYVIRILAFERKTLIV